MSMMRAAGLGLLLLAAPVAAQPAAAPPAGAEGRWMGREGQFSGLSEAGKATMREAMRGSMEGRQAEREQVRAARDRMLTLLEADRLDVAALKRAMDEERSLAAASQERRQAAMLAAYQKLSVDDRKALVAGARRSREEMQDRMRDRIRDRVRNRRG
jgi:Spy/CpxP family protein refolding chaperone